MAFPGRFVGDLGATMAAGGVLVGERLGLYRALAARPQTPTELADATGTDARYVEEWLRYSFSAFLCVPNALSQPGGYALGAQAGESAVRWLVTDAGFTRLRRAAETPFNVVFEAAPDGPCRWLSRGGGPVGCPSGRPVRL